MCLPLCRGYDPYLTGWEGGMWFSSPEGTGPPWLSQTSVKQTCPRPGCANEEAAGLPAGLAVRELWAHTAPQASELSCFQHLPQGSLVVLEGAPALCGALSMADLCVSADQGVTLHTVPVLEAVRSSKAAAVSEWRQGFLVVLAWLAAEPFVFCRVRLILQGFEKWGCSRKK